jgi:hypothetical protein
MKEVDGHLVIFKDTVEVCGVNDGRKDNGVEVS